MVKYTEVKLIEGISTTSLDWSKIHVACVSKTKEHFNPVDYAYERLFGALNNHLRIHKIYQMRNRKSAENQLSDEL